MSYGPHPMWTGIAVTKARNNENDVRALERELAELNGRVTALEQVVEELRRQKEEGA